MKEFKEFNYEKFNYEKFKESMKSFGLSCVDNISTIKKYGEFRNESNLPIILREFVTNLSLLNEYYSLSVDINIGEFMIEDSSFADLLNLVRKDVCRLRFLIDETPNLSDKFKSCVNLVADLMCFANVDVYRFYRLLPKLTENHNFRNLIEPYTKVEVS